MHRWTIALMLTAVVGCQTTRSPSSHPAAPKASSPRPPVTPPPASGESSEGTRGGPIEAELGLGLAASKRGQHQNATEHFEHACAMLEKQTGERVKSEFPYPSVIENVIWSRDGGRFVVSDDAGVSVFTRHGEALFRQNLPPEDGARVRALAIAGNGSRLASKTRWSDEWVVTVFDVNEGVPLKYMDGAESSEIAMALSSNGDALLLCGGVTGCSCTLVDAKTGEERAKVACKDAQPVREVAFSPDDQWFAIGHQTGSELWNVKTLASTGVLASGTELAFDTPKSLSFESSEGSRERYDIDSHKLLETLRRPTSISPGAQRRVGEEWRNGTQFAWRGQVGATLDAKGALTVWRTADGASGRRWDGPFTNFAISPDGRTIAAVRPPFANGGGFDVLDVASGDQREFPGSLPVAAVGIDSRTQALAIATSDGRAAVLHPDDSVTWISNSKTNGRLYLSDKASRLSESSTDVRIWKEGDAKFERVAEDGYLVGPNAYVTRSASGVVLHRIGEEKAVEFDEPESMMSAALSQDGRLLAVGIFGCAVDMFAVRTTKRLARLAGAPGPKDAGEAEAAAACAADWLSFSPNSKRLLAVQADGQIVLSDTQTFRTLQIVPGPFHGGIATDSGMLVVDRYANLFLRKPKAKEPEWGLAMVGFGGLASFGHWFAASDALGVRLVDEGYEFMSVRTWRNTDALVVIASSKHVQIVGRDTTRAQELMACRSREALYPYALCAHRFSTSGLFSTTLQDR